MLRGFTAIRQYEGKTNSHVRFTLMIDPDIDLHELLG